MTTPAPRTMFAKLWDDHVVERLDEMTDLVYIDRHFLHDLSGPFSMKSLGDLGLSVRRPDLTLAFPDHGVSSAPTRLQDAGGGGPMLDLFRSFCADLGIHLFDLDSPDQGIVHVVAPELGLTLPGTTVVCGDSHTCTQGALGALAWGIGNTEVTQVLATQTLMVDRPRTMRIRLEGRADSASCVGAKDIALALLARDGADAATGFAVEFAGTAVAAMSMEARLTLCNLALEMGARFAFLAPDETTIAYVKGRRFAPHDEQWEGAVADWRRLPSDPGARFDREASLDLSRVAPSITWGTSPAHGIAIDGAVPRLADAPDAATHAAWTAALQYMGLREGEPLLGLPVQHVFVGSCTNSRLEDLVAAARIARGRRVAPGVRAWVVAGSRRVQRQAVELGLDRVFTEAGFEWREPGCSMCIAMNGDSVPAGERAVSTSNRNFVGRQGPAARTHLAGPAAAAAAAVTGAICDPRTLAAADAERS